MAAVEEPGFRVLILTVGQTREPLETALAEHTPNGVVFIASQSSQVTVAPLLQEYGSSLKHYTLLIEDPESLIESYQIGQRALAKALEWEARVVLADLTGGTKPMVAGVMLALSGQGVTFSYVGGERRDRLGRVESGYERVRLLEDPSVRYGLREWEGFRRAWNAGNFPAGLDFLQGLLARPLTHSEQRFYTHLTGITEGLVEWDRFQHREAQKKLARHLEPALAIAEAWSHGAKVRVLRALEKAYERLEQLLGEGNRPSFALLADLMANAQRRAEAGRYDDALARLYRAVELAAEADIHQRHGLVLRRPDTYPKSLAALQSRASSLRGLKETLALAFELDTQTGHTGTLSQRLYGDYSQRLQNFLERRHHSILAHGTKAVSPADYTALWNYLAEYGLEAAPAWPKW